MYKLAKMTFETHSTIFKILKEKDRYTGKYVADDGNQVLSSILIVRSETVKEL